MSLAPTNAFFYQHPMFIDHLILPIERNNRLGFYEVACAVWWSCRDYRGEAKIGEAWIQGQPGKITSFKSKTNKQN